ncbi:class I SAM-dependent methyltransferase [Actinomadura sp. WMMB 499]|uniref:class I SAM-dependent methyltransferase n=1 Tax=Actinomadura sp. WMMB 499 TaxID=1219491 RepID=UPI0012480F58|nr:class I SAM-dependent methyltransferase [Actinomadura sp. WMMB 499]QFG26253.1 methyltransferase domain-containing protein [Actinomadura sp. WMMB 499]
MSSSRAPRTAEVFDAAARDHGAAASLLWDPLGEEYVERVAPAHGERVLDACCGAGASAIAAGRAVGATGRVDAVDLAAGLVDLGRRRAVAEGLDHVRFHVDDVAGWSAARPYDLLLCGYGVFFLPDMDASARRLSGMLRPGGRFTVATWAEGALEEFGALLFRSLSAERPRLPEEEAERAEPPARRASRRIDTADALARWAAGLGLSDVRVHRIDRTVPLDRDNAWNLVLGSGFRAMVIDLDEEVRDRVRDRFLDALDAENVRALDAASLVVVGTV